MMPKMQVDKGAAWLQELPGKAKGTTGNCSDVHCKDKNI